MGSIVPLTSPRHQISYRVEGCANIDKIVIYRNLNPIHIAEGLTMMPKSEDNRYKIRIEMGWGNNEQELFPWKGRIRVSDGQILEAEPCFRGRSVLAPSASQDVSQDNINEIDKNNMPIKERFGIEVKNNNKLPKILIDFLSYLETIKGKSYNTIEAYKIDLSLLFKYLKVYKGYPIDRKSVV